MADQITGREIIVAAAKASTWRTAVSLGAGDGVLITSESMGAKAPTFVPDDSLGQADITETYQTHEMQSGSFKGYLRYEGWDYLMANILGSAGTPTNVEGTAYKNAYQIADTINSIFGTFAMKKANLAKGIWEVPSFKPHGFTIAGEVGGLVEITLNEMGSKIETENPTNTSLASVTYPTRSNILKIDSSAEFLMNAQSGAALAGGDQIYPFSFELTYNRPMEADYEAGYNDMSEPTQNGFAEARIRLTFDKYNSNAFMQAIENATNQKMSIKFQGALITGTTYYQMIFYLPNIEWESGEAPASSPGKIPHTVEGRCMAVTSAPSGMASTDDPPGIDVLDPLAIYVQNTKATSPLA